MSKRSAKWASRNRSASSPLASCSAKLKEFIAVVVPAVPLLSGEHLETRTVTHALHQRIERTGLLRMDAAWRLEPGRQTAVSSGQCAPDAEDHVLRRLPEEVTQPDF